MNKLQDFAELMRAAVAEKKAKEQAIAVEMIEEANAAAAKKEKRKKRIQEGAKQFLEVLTVKPEPIVEVQAPVEQTPVLVEEDLIANVAGMFEATTENLVEADTETSSTVKRLQNDIAQLRRYIDAKVSSIDTGWQGGGGGAARIADLDDVDVRTVPVAENDVLMYDPVKRKWLPKTLADLANDLGPLIGGKLYAPYNRMIDVVGTKTYIGEAQPGVNVTQTGWRIKMIEELPSGDLQIIWADGSEDFTLIWDNRLTYTYEVV
jgi:hypothetical protein